MGVVRREWCLRSGGWRVWSARESRIQRIAHRVPDRLIPTAIGIDAVARASASRLSQAAIIQAVLSAVSMAAGLLRWPSLQWQLALAYRSGSPAARESIEAVFHAANSYLGNSDADAWRDVTAIALSSAVVCR